MADGRLAVINKSHDLVRAGEMEGYGHALGCDRRRPPVPWLVVRGISDYGDADKAQRVSLSNPKPKYKHDGYHPVAALTAATFLRTFLETTYTPRSIPKARLEERDFLILDDKTVIVVKDAPYNSLSVSVVRRFKMQARVGGSYRFFRTLKGAQTKAAWGKCSLVYDRRKIPLKIDDEQRRDLGAPSSITLTPGERLMGLLESTETIPSSRGFYSLNLTAEKQQSQLYLRWCAKFPSNSLDVFYCSEHLAATPVPLGKTVTIPASDSGVSYVLRWR